MSGDVESNPGPGPVPAERFSKVLDMMTGKLATVTELKRSRQTEYDALVQQQTIINMHKAIQAEKTQTSALDKELETMRQSIQESGVSFDDIMSEYI